MAPKAYRALATAHAQRGNLSGAFTVLDEVRYLGLQHKQLAGQLLHLAAAGGHTALALRVFESLKGPTVQAWNDLVRAFAVAGDLGRLYDTMVLRYDAGFRVDPDHEMAFFRACFGGDFGAAGSLLNSGLVSDGGRPYVPNQHTLLSLIEAYRSRGQAGRLHQLVQLMQAEPQLAGHARGSRLVVAALDAYAVLGAVEEAEQLVHFIQGQHTRTRQDVALCVWTLQALTSAPGLTTADRQAHLEALQDQLIRNRMPQTRQWYNALLLYHAQHAPVESRVAVVEDLAHQMPFSRTPEGFYTAMVQALASGPDDVNKIERIEEIFTGLSSRKIIPTPLMFSSLISAHLSLGDNQTATLVMENLFADPQLACFQPQTLAPLINWFVIRPRENKKLGRKDHLLIVSFVLPPLFFVHGGCFAGI